MLASKAKSAMAQQDDKRVEAMEKVLKNLVAVAVLGGMITDDGI